MAQEGGDGAGPPRLLLRMGAKRQRGTHPPVLAAHTNHGLVLQAQGQDLAPSPRTERAWGSCPPQHNLPAPGASFPTNHSTSKLKLQIGIPEH